MGLAYGDLSRAKVVAKTYALPANLKNRSFEEDDYRKSFQIFIDTIWLEKEQTIKDLGSSLLSTNQPF